MSEGYLRHLLSEEIADLEMNGCTADNWENIKVASPFHAEHVCNVHFSGSVALGVCLCPSAESTGGRGLVPEE